MIRILFFILLFFGFSALADETNAEPQNDVVKKVENYLNGITTAQADFLQVAPDGGESTGKFYMSRPGKMRWQYDPPVPVLIIVGGGLLSYYDSELDQISHVPSSTNLSAFLARDKIELSGDIKVLSAKDEFGLITINITQTKKTEEGNLTLIFSNSPMQLKKMIVENSGGKQTQITFENMVFDISLDKNLFIMPNPRLQEKPRSRN